MEQPNIGWFEGREHHYPLRVFYERYGLGKNECALQRFLGCFWDYFERA